MVLCSTPNGIALARVCRETPRAAAVAADPAAIGGVRLHAEQVMQTGGAAAKLEKRPKLLGLSAPVNCEMLHSRDQNIPCEHDAQGDRDPPNGKTAGACDRTGTQESPLPNVQVVYGQESER